MIVSQNYTWSNARTQCAYNDGYLMVFDDAAEMGVLTNRYMNVLMPMQLTFPDNVWVYK